MKKINFTYIYNIKGEIKLIDILNYNIIDFKKNSTLYYPDFDITTMYVTDTKIENPIFKNNVLREKTREELILDGNTELLFNGEYINNGKIVVVPMLENAISQEWDKQSHTWIDTTTSAEIARKQYLEYKPLDTPLLFISMEKQGIKAEYVDMMTQLQTIMSSTPSSSFTKVVIPKPSQKLIDFKNTINKIGG